MGSYFADRRWTSSTVKLHIFAQTVAKVCNTATKSDADGNATMRHTFTTEKTTSVFPAQSKPAMQRQNSTMCKGRPTQKSLQKATTFLPTTFFVLCGIWHKVNCHLCPVKQLRFNFLTQKNKEKGNGLLPFP